jgi:hypothetical protein
MSQTAEEALVTLRYPVRITLAGLTLGLAFDRLIVNHALGAGFPLFIVLLLGALALMLSWERLAPSRQNLLLFAPVLFFAAMIAVRANDFVTFLNIVAVLLLLAVIAVFLLRQALVSINLPSLVLSPIVAPVMAILRGGQTSQQAAIVASNAWRGQSRRGWLPVARGILLASPVVLLFALLLSSADLMFAEVLRRILPVDFLTFVQRLLSHGLIVLFVGFFLVGGLAYTVWREERSKELIPISASVPPVIGLTESAVVLNAVNVLFAAFVLIQIPYLFGGQLNIDLGRITYAEYARRGFGELVTTSVLVLGMLLVLGTLTRRESARDKVIFNLSCTLTVGLTVVMLASAFKRLLLYEMAYGFTEMRIYPHVFMIWLGLLLGWFLVTLWVKPGRFAIGLLVACIGFVATLNVLNVDDFIVRQNVLRYERLGTAAFSALRSDDRIDPAYLTQLSEDAIPALVQSVDRLSGPSEAEVREFLLKRYAGGGAEDWRRDWRSAHLSRWLAYRSLALWHDARG